MDLMKIKHNVRDILIFLFSLLGISWCYRKCIRRGPLVRVVAFHDVPNGEWFESTITTLKDKFHLITPAEFYTKKFHTKKINILITFDDGYQSWVDTALSVLRTHGVTALFFINSGLIDTATNGTDTDTFMRERLRISPKKALSWEGVTSLHDAGHTIGGHTQSHPNLAEVSPEEIFQEIKNDKKNIEEKLEITVTDFAYPFGTHTHIPEGIASIVKEAGYTRAYTAMSGFVGVDETFMIPRMCIESDIAPRALTQWTLGAYDLFGMMK